MHNPEEIGNHIHGILDHDHAQFAEVKGDKTAIGFWRIHTWFAVFCPLGRMILMKFVVMVFIDSVEFICYSTLYQYEPSQSHHLWTLSSSRHPYVLSTSWNFQLPDLPSSLHFVIPSKAGHPSCPVTRRSLCRQSIIQMGVVALVKKQNFRPIGREQ